jgi:hypothetical protein
VHRHAVVAMMPEIHCPACRTRVVPAAPKTAWKIACAVFWICALLTATAFSLLPGLNILLVPVWFGIGGAVGAAAERAYTWTCPRCHSPVTAPTPEQLVLRHA